ncbi:MAG: hypothetical protein EBZ48_05450 [Proteobacteria bacterium]|nr:hypothetical protein [Pseudomonadota bacterium]
MGTFVKVLSGYRNAALEASRSLARNLWVLLFCAVAYLAIGISGRLLAPFGMAGGMVLGLLQIALLTYFYSWIAAAVERERVNWSNFHNFDSALFMRLISVAFIFFAISFLLQTFSFGRGGAMVALFTGLAVAFIFNAIPEVVVVKEFESIGALQYAFGFVRDNFFTWFIPLLLMVAPLLLISPENTLILFAQTDPLLPALFIFQTILGSLGLSSFSSVAIPVAVVGTVWCTLFRMYLFKAPGHRKTLNLLANFAVLSTESTGPKPYRP